MNTILFCFTLFVCFGAEVTRAMVQRNSNEGLNAMAILQYYQMQCPNVPAPAHLLKPKQPQPSGQPQTAPFRPSIPSVPSAPSANAPQSQSQLQPGIQPQPQSQTPSATGTGMPNMPNMPNTPNVDPVTQMLLLAQRMKRRYMVGEPLASIPQFFPGGWVMAADGTDAIVLGKNGKRYSIDSNRMCIGRRCARIF